MVLLRKLPLCSLRVLTCWDRTANIFLCLVDSGFGSVNEACVLNFVVRSCTALDSHVSVMDGWSLMAF